MSTDNRIEDSKIMDKLARHLVVNHLRVDLRGKDWQPVLRKEIEFRDPHRTIAVIGAGASRAAGLPLASEAINMLSDDLKISKTDYTHEKERLELVHGFAQATFETALLAFSNIVYPPEKVRDCVKEMYDIRYRPLFVYEVLAHMLKHRFLDAIVNFNFDELLDQSIADELTPTEYHYVVHDGDCPETAGDHERPYDLPVYLKPHGTVSHGSSLRFTAEAYYGIPNEVRRVLQNLISGMPVTLLVIGFSMQSPELNKLIEQSRFPIDIFYVSHDKPNPALQSSSAIKDHFMPVTQSANANLDNVMRQIWLTVSKTFKEPFYTPRGIQRHELVCKIFADPGVTTKREQSDDVAIKKYLFDRTVVELALSIAKAKGLLNMSVISQDRCGMFYNLYCNSDPPKLTPLYDICLSLELEEIGYAREALRLKQEEKHLGNPFWILGKEAFEAQLDQLFRKVFGQLSAQNKPSMGKSEQEFRAALIYLYASQEIELRGLADPLYNKIFRSPRPIWTLTGLNYETERLLQRQRWDKLFVIAETGEWLLAPRIVQLLSERDAEIYMVAADQSFKAELEGEFGDKLKGIRQLPWWDHNRHLTLILDDHIPQGAIYFTRRLRSPFISPVVLSYEDANVVLSIFIAYWRKADKDMPWIGPNELDVQAFFKSL